MAIEVVTGPVASLDVAVALLVAATGVTFVVFLLSCGVRSRVLARRRESS